MLSDKIKVFFFIDSFRIGGMHRQVLYLVKHLNKDTFEPMVCTQIFIGSLLGEFELTGCKLFDLRWKRKFDLATIYRLIKILKVEKPDIVFITEAQNLFYYRVAKIFWRRQVIQIGSFRALTFWKGHLKKIYQPIDNFFSRWLVATSDHVVVNSVAMKNHYLKIVKTKSVKSPIKVIYNGSDFNFAVTRSKVEIRKELNIGPDEIAVIMVARLDPWKDFYTLLEAAKIVIKTDPTTKFLLIGDGMLKHSLEQLIVKMNLKENVFLLGERNDVYNYINTGDILVLSTHGEGFSNSILESMAYCKPVIATNVGGNAELLGSKSEFGLLVPPKSPGLLANAILVLTRDEALRTKMGKSAREHILQLCDIKKYILAYEDLFLRSLKKI